MDENKQDYQEFIQNKKVISRFDPFRKDRLVRMQLYNKDGSVHKDHTKINILKSQPNHAQVKSIVSLNFKKIIEQNLPKLMK